MNWTTEQMPDQAGRSFMVTGANTGLGFQTATELAKKNARVVMAGRDPQKLGAAADQIRSDVPSADLRIQVVDLSNLSSVRSSAQEFLDSGVDLDVLINNAGIMFPPPSLTADGFESQFAVNFLSPFLLTGLLFPLLQTSDSGRVVTVSSISHRGSSIDFDNLKLEQPFDKFREYGQSKLADLIFTIELQRRLDAVSSPVLSVGAHPGVSKTELLRNDKPEMIDTVPHMTANQGSFPTLFAATERVVGGSYYGPDGQNEMTGYPAPATIDPAAVDAMTGSALWELAEQETGVQFP